MNTPETQPGMEFHQTSPHFQWYGRVLSRLMGWTIKSNLPDDPRMVLVFFPHSSNMDALHIIPAAFALGLKPNWLVKDEVYIAPLKGVFDKLGGVPINRRAAGNKVEQIAAAIREADRVILALSPEGTRSKTEYWRSGFYHIASLAEVPIHFAYIDYPSKTVGFEPGFIPTGDIDADMVHIRAFYADKRARFPQNVGPVRVKISNL